MEPVEGVENVPKNRWKLVCSLCKERVGACIQCENKSCFTAFHVTCARQTGLLMSMKLMGADGQMKAYCEKHLPVSLGLLVRSLPLRQVGARASSRTRMRKTMTTTIQRTILPHQRRNVHARILRPPGLLRLHLSRPRPRALTPSRTVPVRPLFPE